MISLRFGFTYPHAGSCVCRHCPRTRGRPCCTRKRLTSIESKFAKQETFFYDTKAKPSCGKGTGNTVCKRALNEGRANTGNQIVQEELPGHDTPYAVSRRPINVSLDPHSPPRRP